LTASLKKFIKYIFSSLAGVVLLLVAAAAIYFGYYFQFVHTSSSTLTTAAAPGSLGRWVNPFIGTGGVPWVCGHNFPGATTPLGMVRLSPETASILFHKRALNTSGYYYGDAAILGFSHTRLSGTGAVDGGHFRVLPVSESNLAGAISRKFYSSYSHDREIAFPGYYAVELQESGVLAELTATPRSGVHRYTFSKKDMPHVLIDVSSVLGKGRSREGYVRIVPKAGQIEGSIKTFGTFSGRYGGIRVYFVAQFNRPWSAAAIWNNGKREQEGMAANSDDLMADVSFQKSTEPLVVEMQLAISYVSIDNARLNLQTETTGKSFAAIQAASRDDWERYLGLIEIDGATDQQRRIFYTALYRSFTMPTRFADVNGDYTGFDKQIHQAKEFCYYTDMSLWDTFRTVHPLLTLIAPTVQRDCVRSLVEMAKQGGWLPRWPSGHGYTNSMLGTPADIVIAESWLKGIRDFDVDTACQAMLATALAPTPHRSAFSGREGVEHYLHYGYCPSELMDEAVSRTLEFGWSDHAIALLASELGRSHDADILHQHSQFYRNLWNPQTQYFQPRDSKGHFVEPFKPLLLTYFDFQERYTGDYVEGNALQWRWGVFYDPQGLISLFKSRDYFISELNSFFAKAGSSLGSWKPDTYYWHGNQPDLHAAYLFNAAGRPDLTQKWVRWILRHKYDDGFVGLEGNDDGGTLSAWYVFSALGFYPVAGTTRYELAAPLFQRALIHLQGRTLEIHATPCVGESMYAMRVTLNNVPLDRTWVTHAELAGGGVLQFDMSDKGAQAP
jgi:predicted alpha-1,2-mannosidase